MLFLVLCIRFEELKGVLFNALDPVLKMGFLTVRDLDGLVNELYQIVSPLVLLCAQQVNIGAGKQSEVGLRVVGVNVLDNHKGDGQFEQTTVQQRRHLSILQGEQWQHSIDLLYGPISNIQLELVLVLGQVHAVDGAVMLGQLGDHHLPWVHKGPIVPLHLQRVPDYWECFHQIELSFTEI